MKLTWKKDNMNDYVITVDRSAEGIPVVRGRIVRCPITKPFGVKGWRTQARWLLMVNNRFYGFWKSLQEAQGRFDRDCVPKGNCSECGHPNGSSQCCQNDEELWK